jgi:hypothetical protein
MDKANESPSIILARKNVGEKNGKVEPGDPYFPAQALHHLGWYTE